MDIIEQSRDLFGEEAFLGISQCFYGSPYGIKEHKKDEIFLSTILLKHASPIRHLLYI